MVTHSLHKLGVVPAVKIHDIESKGGKVEQFLTVAAAQYSANIALSVKTRVEILSAYGVQPLLDFLKENDMYGGKFEYLTESEARTILRAGSLDGARDRIAQERQEGRLKTDTRTLGNGTREPNR